MNSNGNIKLVYRSKGVGSNVIWQNFVFKFKSHELQVKFKKFHHMTIFFHLELT